MRLHLLDRSSIDNTSITVSHNCYPHFLKIWHFHEELELVYILKSSGTRFIGDHIGKFDRGELVLIGKNVPHMWLNDDSYFDKENPLEAEAVAIHFKENFAGQTFFSLPEMSAISKLLAKASQGIRFFDLTDTLKNNLLNLSNYNDGIRFLRILEILLELAQTESFEILSSNGFINTFHKTADDKMNNIYEFVFNNFHNAISAKDVANHIHMNPSAFSRFFKNTHRKPFTRFLNEIRVGFACKLLLENKESITHIAFISGFGNISNFNRQFKLIKGETPRSYLKRHQKHF